MAANRRVRVVLVDSGGTVALCRRLLLRQGIALTVVGTVGAALALCRAGSADLCLVAARDSVLDAAPVPATAEPHWTAEVPAILLVAVVTPFWDRLARRCGYFAVVAAGTGANLLYRRIAAALQGARAGRRRGLAGPIGPLRAHPPLAMPGDRKPTMH